MQQQAQNTYIGGINRDKSKHLPNKDTMWNNENFRVLTQEGDSSLALVTVKGNKEIKDNGGTPLNTEVGFSIIGHGVIRNDVILFATSDDGSEGVLPTKSRIYLFKWDNVNDVFYPRINLYEDDNNSVTGTLSEGLQLQAKIDTVTRWETNYIQKVYWTDGVNNIRYVNISPDIDSTTGLPKDGSNVSHYTRTRGMDIEDFDIVQKMELPEPLFEGYASGELRAGMIQFSYRFYNLYGGESMFGQASNLIPIFKDSHTNNSINIKGSLVDTNCKKTVKGSLALYGANLKFDRVEIVSLWYPILKGVPTINVIDIQKIADTDVAYTINFEDTGTDYLDSISLEEYRNIKSDYIAKTFNTKDDRVFLGNIKERYFDIGVFDTRAYRFNSSGDCVIYDNEGTGKVVTPGTYDTVPEDHDCINWYKNDLTHDEAVRLNPALDYQYKSDGVTRGGSGLNIDYRFGFKTFQKDNGNSNIQAGFDYDKADTEWQLGTYKGFQHDEIYRFGIVFFDNKGRQSFVRWIGDIRIPRHDEYAAMEAVYPVFNVHGELPKNSDGTDVEYQIVYVKREGKDRTVIANGICRSVESDMTGNGVTTRYSMYENPTCTGSTATVPVIATRPAINATEMLFYSPELDFNDIDLNDTYISFVLKSGIDVRTVVTEGEGLDGTERFSGVVKLAPAITPLSVPYNSVKVRYTRTVDSEAYLLAAHSKIMEFGKVTTLPDNAQFFSYTSEGRRLPNGVRRPLSVVTDALFLKTSSPMTVVGSYASIRRKIKGYGGDTYVDRQQNTYIPAAGLNSWNCVYGDTYIGWHSRQYSGIGQLYNDDGERGDIMTTSRDINSDIWAGETFTENSGSTINMLFKVETSVVLPLSSGDDLNRRVNDGDARLLWIVNNRKTLTGTTKDTSDWLAADNSVKYLHELDYDDAHIYNPVYSKVHDDKVFFPKPLDWQKQVHFDTRIRWSNPKINGEERDSWLKYLANNMQDVDNRYGSLNRLVNFKNTLFAFQEAGFCQLPVNERAVTSGTSGSAVSLGSGSVLPKHMNYMAGSTVAGIQNGNNVIQSSQAIYWIDANKKKLYRYTGQTGSLSDVKGLSGYFGKEIDDKTTYIGAYNNRYAEVMVTVNNTTIVYNELIDAFQGWFTLAPTDYIKTPIKFLTSGNSKLLWEHDVGNYGTWYNEVYHSVVSLIVNPDGSVTKEFNNVQYMSESSDINGIDIMYDTLNTLQGSNDYQSSEVIELLPYNNGDTLYVGGLQIPVTAPTTIKNIRRRERIWRTVVPRVEEEILDIDNQRLRDAYCKLTFTYYNADNNRLVLHNMITFYRNASKT